MNKIILKIKIFATHIIIKNMMAYFVPGNQKFIHHWREYFFNIVFFLIFLFITASFIIAVIFQIISKNLFFIIVGLFIYIFFTLIIYLKQIPYLIRSYLGCFIFYILGFVIFFKVGPVSSGLFWFFMFSMFNSSFNGLRGFVFSNLMIILAVAFFQIMIPVYDFNWTYITKDFYDSRFWLLTGITLIVLNAGMSSSVYFFMNHFEKMLIKNSDSKNAIIIGLASLAEYRDYDTGKHLERISKYAVVLTKELRKLKKYRNYITDEYIDDLSISSILHDIGKVGIEDKILLKPGKLDKAEYESIKMHTIIGSNVIKNINDKIKDRYFLNMANQIILYHHEKYDGSGYPNGLKGEDIPLSARIIAIADVYDALTTKRIYKEDYSHVKAIDIIKSEKGRHFDPDIVDAFINVNREIDDIRKLFYNGLK